MTTNTVVYFDNNATTSVDPAVLEAMLPFLTERWGNPSSAYRFGHDLARHLDRAREQVAALLHADPREILFTSCGTESNNTAWHSALAVTGRNRILTTAVEHSANLACATQLRQRGCTIDLLPVAPDGSLDLLELDRAIGPDTALVSVMWANNETGVLFPIPEIAALSRAKGVLCHTDATQIPGKLPIDLEAVPVDLLSISGHKFHAPKGIGALFVRRRTRFQPLIVGGHQERGRRAGTENVPYIVGLGRAAELALANLADENTRVRALRDRLETSILATIPGVTRNGAREPRLPNTASLAFDRTEAEALLLLLDQAGICASSGSACTTGSPEPSHVLTAMRVPPARARGTIRFSLGRDNTDADVDSLLNHLPGIVARLRAAAPPSL
jgi:cysteine desulfurase